MYLAVSLIFFQHSEEEAICALYIVMFSLHLLASRKQIDSHFGLGEKEIGASDMNDLHCINPSSSEHNHNPFSDNTLYLLYHELQT